MFLYNTLTEKKEELTQPTNGPLNMFVCGPTVYDTPHIGNGRTYVLYDMFARYLRSQKWDIFYLQNITDID
ncbi:MAG: cysteine--tRNA ligase, partial [Candidatus Harrisonbacteria bacterium]|nr:cysteine--tRNA ligase [Candidatus Harrisonbacteria bacterium]